MNEPAGWVGWVFTHAKGIGAVIGAASAALAASWAIWDYAELPKVATQRHVQARVGPITEKLDKIERSSVSGRIEGKLQHREFLQDRKFELQLRLDTDQSAGINLRAEMQRRIAEITERIDSLDNDIRDLRLQRRQGMQGSN